MKFSLTFALTLAYLVAAAPQPRPENETRTRSRSWRSRPTITSTASPEAASSSDVASAATSSSASSSSRGNPSTTTRGSPALTQTSSLASPSATYTSVGRERDVVGAVYFLTNVPDSNNIVVGTIGSDGNVTYAGAVFAGGSGQHGNDGGTFAADATFSNNLIVVHSERQLLAAANTKSNTIALFSVDPEDPSNLQMLGSPASSQGDFPNSLSFNKAGDKLCTVNAGEVANIMCFDVNDDGLKPQMDSIRPLPNYNQTTPPTGPSHTAGAIAFTPDEQNIVVVIKGTQEPPSSGYLSVWAVQDDGAIVSDPTVIQKDGASVLPFSLTPIPEQNAFLSSDLTSAVDIFDLDGGAAKASKSAATDSISIDGDLSLCWSTYSPSLERFYLSAPPQSTVIEVAVDKDSLQPSVIASHVIPNQVLNTDITVGTIGDKDFLFTLLTNDPGIAVLSLDGPGQTTLVGTAAFSDSLAKEGVPSRPNYSQGLALFMKP